MGTRHLWSSLILLALVNLFESKPITTDALRIPITAETGNTSVLTSVGNSTLNFPRGFKLERIPYRTPTPFTAEAIFFNIVHALEQLAPLNYRDLMRPRKFHTPEFPSPVISIRSPFPWGTIIRRDFAVDSLWQAFEMMCQDRRFESSRFEMVVGSTVVGEIAFEEMRTTRDTLERPTVGDSNREARSNKFDNVEDNKVMVNPPKSSIAPTNLTDLSIGRFSLRYLHAGLAYSKTDLMMTLIGMLVAAAEPPKETRLRSRMVFGARRTALSQIVVAPNDRTTAPYMEYLWIIEIAAEMARFMVHRSIWRELNVLVDVDDIQIGVAIIEVPRNALERPGNGSGGSTTEA